MEGGGVKKVVFKNFSDMMCRKFFKIPPCSIVVVILDSPYFSLPHCHRVHDGPLLTVQILTHGSYYWSTVVLDYLSL